MELNEFVSETLKQIIEGVKTVQWDNRGYSTGIIGSKQEHLLSTGATINPKYSGDLRHYELHKECNLDIIEFDVAITVTEQEKKDRGGGLKISVLSADASKSLSETNQTVSKVKFKVPITLPEQIVPEHPLEAKVEKKPKRTIRTTS